ncbi:MAG: RNA methyltransferase [Actinobacteria bacterium]|nr:RNA methyltransferase [Actinomycetota bacterium]
MTAGTVEVRSPRNPRVKAAAALARRKIRDAQQRYLVEGPRSVRDLLTSGDVDEVFAVPEMAVDLEAAAQAAGVRLTVVDEPVLRHLADSVTPQGAVAVARQRRADLADVVGRGHLIVLHEVADPGNAGTAIRTAAASGAAGIVLTVGSVDPWNPKAVRASAGVVARLPIVTGSPTEDVLVACAAAEQTRVALDVAGPTAIDAPGILTPPVALLFGNEAHGLPTQMLQAVDEVVAIPLLGPVESLNLAASVAVAAYAAARAGASRADR